MAQDTLGPTFGGETGPGEPSQPTGGGGWWSTVAGAFDHSTGSVDESVGRQFNETQGGGFVDEVFAVVDPARGGSPQTEADLRSIFDQGPVGGFWRASDIFDVSSGETPPQFEDVPPEETPQGDGNWLPENPGSTLGAGGFPTVDVGEIGADLGEWAGTVADQATPGWLDWVVDHQEETILLLVLLLLVLRTDLGPDVTDGPTYEGVPA